MSPRTLILARVLIVSAVLAGVVLPATAATAATTAAPRPVGGVWTATQSGRSLHLTGWAYDASQSRASVQVKFYDGRAYLGRARAGRRSPVVNRVHHVRGEHRFAVTLDVAHWVGAVRVRTPGAHRGHRVTVAVITVRHVAAPAATATPAARVLALARSYVGHARYRDGGTNPRTGFDCSGYTQYVYAHAHAAYLPRTAEAQRRAAHRVSAARARPGDLVFYLSGGGAYHVAIYAGHHMQYAAATPRDGIRYQAVWSSSVVYGRVL